MKEYVTREHNATPSDPSRPASASVIQYQTIVLRMLLFAASGTLYLTSRLLWSAKVRADRLNLPKSAVEVSQIETMACRDSYYLTRAAKSKQLTDDIPDLFLAPPEVASKIANQIAERAATRLREFHEFFKKHQPE